MLGQEALSGAPQQSPQLGCPHSGTKGSLEALETCHALLTL
jgi:hypothetical protein